MIKKITSVAFVLIAICMIMAHDVIPHHHHDDHVCFEHHSCGTHHSNSEAPNFPGENDDSCCLLADITLILSGSHKNEIHCSCCEADREVHLGFTTIFNSPNHEHILLLTPLPFRQNPFFSPFYLLVASHTAGLRAPPVV